MNTRLSSHSRRSIRCRNLARRWSLLLGCVVLLDAGAAGLDPGWAPLTGLPPSSYAYAFAFAGGRAYAANTTAGDPHLWLSDRIGPNAVWTELPFDPYWLNSSWTWPRQFKGLATLETTNGPRVFVASSGGVFEVEAATGTTNALARFWSWSWDTTDAVRAARSVAGGAGLSAASCGLLWSVWSFGRGSGYYFWTPESGVQFLHWADAAVTNQNQLYSISTGVIFGWVDGRGFVSPGTNPPPILLQAAGGYPIRSSVSTNGGSTWQPFTYSDGAPVVASLPMEAWGPASIFVVDRLGDLLVGGVEGVLQDSHLPVRFPGSLCFDETSGWVIAGSGSALYVGQLPGLSRGGFLQASAPEAGGVRLRLSGRPGVVHRLEATTDFQRWTPVSTNKVGSSGSWEFLDPQAGSRRFYRAVVLD